MKFMSTPLNAEYNQVVTLPEFQVLLQKTNMGQKGLLYTGPSLCSNLFASKKKAVLLLNVIGKSNTLTI